MLNKIYSPRVQYAAPIIENDLQISCGILSTPLANADIYVAHQCGELLAHIARPHLENTHDYLYKTIANICCG